MNPMNPHADLYTGEAGKRVFNFTNNNSWGWGVPMGWKPTLTPLDIKSSNNCGITSLSGMIFADVPISINDFIIINPVNKFRVFKVLSCKNLGNPKDCWHIVAVSDGIYLEGDIQDMLKNYTWEMIDKEWCKDEILNKLISGVNDIVKKK